MPTSETSLGQQANTTVHKLVSYFIHEKTSTAAHVLVFFVFVLLLGYRYLFHDLVLHPGHDALLYQELARRIWTGLGWWLPSGAPFPPLYPAWLGMFTEVLALKQISIPLAMYLSQTVAVGLCMAISRRIFRSSALAWLWLWVLPIQIIYQFSWSETLTLPLLHLLLLHGRDYRSQRSLPTGLMLSWAALPLIRWANLYWVMASYCLYFWPEGRLKTHSWKELSLAFASALPLLAVWLVNYLKFCSIWGMNRIGITPVDVSINQWIMAVADSLGFSYRWTQTDASISSIVFGSLANVLALAMLCSINILYMKRSMTILYLSMGYVAFLFLISHITYIDAPDFRLLSPTIMALFVGLLASPRDHLPRV